MDGGWGVDALVGRQTREHSDLDMVIDRRDLPTVQALLATWGFAVQPDWLPTAQSWRDGSGREVDLHPIDRTPDGGGDQVLDDGSRWHYDAPVTGTIAGHTVACCSAEQQLAMHSGYEPRPVDRADIRILCARSGLPLPERLAGGTDEA